MHAHAKGAPGAAKDNLTQQEAEARARRVGKVAYALSISLNSGQPTYQGKLDVHFEMKGGPDEGPPIWLDWNGKRIDALELNGRAIDVAKAEQGKRIVLPDELKQQNHVVIRYENDHDTTGVGFHRFVDPEDGGDYRFTDFEPFNAHRLFPCFDQPDLKATYDVSVTAPSSWLVVSNGRQEWKTPAGGDRTRHVFARTKPFSTYLFHISAGDFVVYERAAKKGVPPLRVFCRRSMKKHLDSDADEVFTLTEQGFAFFQDYFGTPYPFEKYDQLFVPEFNAGAMENVGAVTHADRMIYRGQISESQRRRRGEVILHEMAHMWFGDLVTMRWWDDLWLNESFATYMAYVCLVRATRFQEAWRDFRTRIKTWAYTQDELPTTHPIAGTVPDTDATFLNFDGITYGKGASVLKQLTAYLGDQAFREGCRRYFQRHAWGNATLEDFLGALGEGTGRDLHSWSKAWIQSKGLGTLVPEIEARDGMIAGLAVRQEPAASDPTMRPHRVDVALLDEDEKAGRLVVRKALPVTVEGARTDVVAAKGERAAAVVWVDHGDHAYAKTFLDARSLDYVRRSIDKVADPLTLLSLWETLWQMVRDQRMKPLDFVQMIADKMPLEKAADIVEPTLRKALTALGRYLPDDLREDARKRLVRTMWARLEDATVGKDLKIIWTRMTVTTCRHPEDIDRLLRLMDGAEELPGVDVDQDLRWEIVEKLHGNGRPESAGRLAIERERDPSDKGKKAAFRCEVAWPSLESKSAFWQRFEDGGPGSDDLLKTGMSTFRWLYQRDLLEPFVDRFFDEAPKVQEERHREYARAWFELLFPHDRVDPNVLAKAEAYIAKAQGPQKRLILESHHELKRSIACRKHQMEG